MHTLLYLVRHGETDWNVIRRLQGSIDIPLNATGLAQADAAAQAMAGAGITALVSSDLGRARQTAAAIAASCGLVASIEPGLRERCYGAFEGKVPDEIRQAYPDDFTAWRAHDLHARYPAGPQVAETLQEFYDRCVAAIDRVVHAHPGQKVAVVTHGGVLECLYRYATGTSIGLPRDFPIRNAGISRMRWDGQSMVLEDWGNVDHLGGSAQDEIRPGT